jgi:hypothetical protein
MTTTISARIYARGEVSFAKFLFLPSLFAKLLEANFSYFAKIIWMPSWFAKLLSPMQRGHILRSETKFAFTRITDGWNFIWNNLVVLFPPNYVFFETFPLTMFWWLC